MRRLYDREKELEKLLIENAKTKKVYYFDTLSSTNDIAKDIIKESAQDDFVLISREQTKGKGRLSRVWQSKKDAGLYITMVKRIDRTDLAPMLSILAGIATFKALESFAVKDLSIKWPNDLLIGRKKLAGILCELFRDNYVYYAIIGIGVNVNNKDFGKELEFKATSLLMEKYNITLIELAHKIVICFEKVYNNLTYKGDLSQYQDFLNEHVINIGSVVEFIYENKKVNGTALRVNNDGSLRVDIDGKIFDIRSGEVSLEGFYGY